MNDVTAALTPAPTHAPDPKSPRGRLLAAAQQLESVFYGHLFQAMRAAVPEGGLMDKSVGEKVFTGMLDDEVARLATSQTSRGLAESVYKELSRGLPTEAAAPLAGAAAQEPLRAAARKV